MDEILKQKLSVELAKAIVIILSYHGPKNLAKQIPLLDISLAQIMVVCYGKNTETKTYCDNRGIQCLSLMDRNFSQACNTGIRHALAKNPAYIYVIRDDVQFQNPILNHLLAVFLKEQSVGACAPTQMIRKNETDHVVYTTRWHLSHLEAAYYFEQFPEHPDICEADYCEFICTLFSAKIFNEIGLLNEQFQFEMASLEFSYRLWLKGYRILYDQKAQIKVDDSILDMLFNIKKIENQKKIFAKQFLNLGVNFSLKNIQWPSWSFVEDSIFMYANRYGLLDHQKPHLHFNQPTIIVPYLLTVWETTQLPPEWKDNILLIDALFVPSKWNLDIFKNVRPAHNYYLPFGICPDYYHPYGKKFNFDREKVFLVICKDQYRKALDVTLQAWLEVKNVIPNAWIYFYGQDINMTARLGKSCDAKAAHGKLQLHYYTRERIVHLTSPQLLTFTEMAELYRGADVLVNNSRSEGFGFPIIEAMACNTLTIVPNYGGTSDFISGMNCIPLQGKESFANYSEFGFSDVGHWWEPSLSHLKECLVQAYHLSPNDYKTMTFEARQFVLSHYTWRNSMLALRTALEKIQVPNPISLTDALNKPYDQKRAIRSHADNRFIQLYFMFSERGLFFTGKRFLRFMMNRISQFFKKRFFQKHDFTASK